MGVGRSRVLGITLTNFTRFYALSAKLADCQKHLKSSTTSSVPTKLKTTVKRLNIVLLLLEIKTL